MHLLPGVLHTRQFFGVLDAFEHPVPRGLTSARVFEIQINDDLEEPGMNPRNGPRAPLVGRTEPLVRGKQTPDYRGVQPGETIGVFRLQWLDGFPGDCLFESVMPLRRDGFRFFAKAFEPLR